MPQNSHPRNMTIRYQGIYPSEPLLDSSALSKHKAADLLTLEYFEAPPVEMATRVFDQHHILLNLREEPHEVENWRDGKHIKFIFEKDQVVVSPGRCFKFSMCQNSRAASYNLSCTPFLDS